MSESNIIKEFLVALGFKVDESALKKFETGIQQATKSVERLAVSLTATATTVAYGVARMAGNLESLYFASVRTGASATNLRAFARAAQDFGATSGEAMSSVEGLARALRNNPGIAGQINGWLGNVGKSLGSDPVKNLQAIGELFAQNTRNGEQYVNTQLAGMWGIDEKTMLAIQQPGFGKDIGGIYARLKRAGFGDAARQAHAFMVSLRALGDQLVILGVRIEDTLQTKLRISVGALSAWLDKNGPWLADKITSVVGQIMDDFNRVIDWLRDHGPQIRQLLAGMFSGIEIAYQIVRPAVEWVFRKFEEMDSMTDGWSTKLGATLLVLRAIGATSIIGGVLALANAFRKLAFATLGIRDAQIASAAASAVPVVGAAAAGVGAGYVLDKWFPHNWLAQAGEKLGGLWYKALHKDSDLVERLTNFGWTRPQAAGIAANLISEDGQLIPGAVGDNGKAYGIGQWHAARQAQFKKLFGHDIRDSTYSEQIEFFNYELRHGSQQKAGKLLKAATNANQAAQIVSLYDLRPAGGLVEAKRRGELAVNLTQSTEIHVHGTKDPHETARAVADNQHRVNAQLVRAAAAVPR